MERKRKKQFWLNQEENRFRQKLDIEEHQQGKTPQDDIFQDAINDEGQEIEHQITAEEESGNE